MLLIALGHAVPHVPQHVQRRAQRGPPSGRGGAQLRRAGMAARPPRRRAARHAVHHDGAALLRRHLGHRARLHREHRRQPGHRLPGEPGEQPAADPQPGRVHLHLRADRDQGRHLRPRPGALHACRGAVTRRSDEPSHNPTRSHGRSTSPSPSATARSWPSSTSRSPRASSSRCSARRAAGRRRCCAFWPGSRWPAAARSSSREVRTVVYQEPRLVASMRVWRNVVIGLPRSEATRERAVTALREVGLEDHADAWPGTLSGGEAQRVALARALVREPQLLLLDEPFAALDALTRLRMQSLVAELCARHHPGVLLVTHDVEEAILLADRVLVLTDSRISLDRHGRAAPAPPGGRRGLRRAARSAPGRARRPRRAALTPAPSSSRRCRG